MIKPDDPICGVLAAAIMHNWPDDFPVPRKDGGNINDRFFEYFREEAAHLLNRAEEKVTKHLRCQ